MEIIIKLHVYKHLVDIPNRIMSGLCYAKPCFYIKHYGVPEYHWLKIIPGCIARQHPKCMLFKANQRESK